MKNLSLSVLAVFAIVASFNACRTIPSAEVNYLSGNEGAVTVRAVGIGKDKERAILNAEQKVFDVLFFRGLPESMQKLPLIGSNETDEKAKHKKYFEEFYEKQRHRSFIMSSVPVTSLAKYRNGQKTITVDVKVNLNALRRDLETSGIVRRFGF